jgi:hypothetical protein
MTDEFESFSDLEIEVGDLLEKAMTKRDADTSINNAERRVLFVIVDQLNGAKSWLSVLASDEFEQMEDKV